MNFGNFLRTDARYHPGWPSVMAKLFLASTLVLLLFLSSCASSQRSIKLDESMIKLVRSEVTIYEQAELSRCQYKIIAPIQATSCMNTPWDPSASQENAIDQLRYITYLKNGNALFKVSCAPKEGITVQNNCLNSITCYGVAIKVIRKY
jgi:hypothetical protein